MRVALIDSFCDRRSPGRGGLSDIVWRLASELARVGVEPVVIGPYPSAHVPEVDRVRFVSGPAPTAVRSNLATLIAERLGLAARARFAAHACVFYTVESVMAAALAASGLGRQTVWHGHMNVLHHSRIIQPWSPAMYRTMLLCSRIAAPRVGRVAVLGPSLARWWTALGTPPDRVVVVPNGVDFPRESANHHRDFRANSQGATANLEARLLYVGRLAPEKGGVDALIQAVALLRERGMLARLEIAGDGPQRPALEACAAAAGHVNAVRFWGMVSPERVPALYETADMVVLPSQGEMLPRVMLEALASGTPFLGTRVGAIPDYLVDNVNGFLLEDASAEGIATSLERILARPDLRAAVSQAGQRTASELTWPAAARALLERALEPLAA